MGLATLEGMPAVTRGAWPWLAALSLGVLACRDHEESPPPREQATVSRERPRREQDVERFVAMVERSEEPSRRGDLGAFEAHERRRLVGFDVYLPDELKGRDYDVVVHFHGASPIVSRCLRAGGIDAVVVAITLGIGSRAYDDALADSTLFPRLLEAISFEMSRDADAPVRERRVALSGWSAGYAAVRSLLLREEVFDRIDAVILLDGPHGGYADGRRGPVREAAVEPFARFAAKAVAGERLMLVTHTQIATYGYASTRETNDALLGALELERVEAPRSVAPPELGLVRDLFARRGGAPILEQLTAVDAGDFHMAGYAGEAASDHIAQLVYMSVTVLDELADRWAR